MFGRLIGIGMGLSLIGALILNASIMYGWIPVGLGLIILLSAETFING